MRPGGGHDERPHGWRREVAEQLRLAVPVAVVQLGQVAMGVVDTAMVGRHDRIDLGALAIGNAFAMACLSFGIGLLLALDPLISQARGAGDEPAIARTLQRGMVLALAVSVPTAGLMLLVGPAVRLVGVQPELVPLSTSYVWTLVPSLPAFYWFFALRTPLQAMSRMRPVVIATIAGNVINVLLNLVLIYGALGVPALGAVGCGWATTISRWLMLGGLLVAAWPLLAPYLDRVAAGIGDPRAMWRIVRLGVPIGGQITVEIGGFAFISLLMGRLGPVEAGAHQIALSIASVSFMIPLSMSIAVAVRVGLGIGGGRPAAARLSATVAVRGGVLVMALFGLLFFLAPRFLASLYSDDDEVIALAAQLIVLAAAFQIFDGLQVVCSGVLRGTGETRAPLIVHALGFWLVAIPAGAYLAMQTALGPRGLWAGLVIGLALVALVLLAVVRRRMSRDLVRLAEHA